MGGISPEDSKDGFEGVPSVASSTGEHSGMTTPQQTSVKVKRYNSVVSWRSFRKNLVKDFGGEHVANAFTNLTHTFRFY